MHHRSSARTAALVLSALAASHTAHAQVIVDLAPMIVIRGLSADGSTVVGGGFSAAKWDNVLGYQALDNVAASLATGASANGAFASGFAFPASYRPMRYLPGPVAQNLGLLPNYTSGQARAISGDGLVVAGWLQQSVGVLQAFRWDNGVMAILPIPNNFQSDAYCVSDDGTAIFGVTSLPGQDAARWRAGFPHENLGNLAVPAGASYPAACNANGTIAVGTHQITSTLGRTAFRWIEGNGFEELALPFFATGAGASDLTADALAIVGSIDTPAGPRAAFWTESGLWIDLNDYLPTVGVNLTGWVLKKCTAVSNNGTTLCGEGTLNNVVTTWLVRDIPPICGPRIDLQPVNTVACANTDTSLVAIATPPQIPTIMSHQWYKRVVSGTGFIDIPLTNGPTGTGSTRVNASGFTNGQSTSSMGINSVSMADAGDYFCVITNGCGSNTTILVNLLVRPNINNDNVIDGADLSVLLANFGDSVTPWTNGDFNGDGIVNGADLSTLLANIGQQC